MASTSPPSDADHHHQRLIDRFYPETAAGGFSRRNGTVEFYLRVNSLLRPEMTVLDYGAGRGAGIAGPAPTFAASLRLLRGKVAKVIGADPDPVVRTNLGLDEAIVLDLDSAGRGALPLPDASVDLIVSDYTFEHVADPAFTAAELRRVLRPGGWLCARTPNRHGYIGLGNTLVPEGLKSGLLPRLQPYRRQEDVFPTTYRMNTRSTLRGLFPGWLDCSYAIDPEPAYAGRSRAAWAAFIAAAAVTPPPLRSILLVFLRKPG